MDRDEIVGELRIMRAWLNSRHFRDDPRGIRADIDKHLEGLINALETRGGTMGSSQTCSNQPAVERLEAKAERLARELLTAAQLLDMARRQAHSWKQKAEELRAALDRAEDDADGWSIAAAAWQARARALEAKERRERYGTLWDEMKSRAEESAARDKPKVGPLIAALHERCDSLMTGMQAAHARVDGCLERLDGLEERLDRVAEKGTLIGGRAGEEADHG